MMSENSVWLERFNEINGRYSRVARWVMTLVLPVPVSPIKRTG